MAPSGENHVLMVFFLAESGLKYCLAQKTSTPAKGSGLPDLFQYGEVVLEQKDSSRPAFLKDFSLRVDSKEIGRSYRVLKAASSLARFFENNLLHLEHFPEAWNLLQVALDALSTKDRPDVTLFKTFFAFGRSEGYPVIAHWLRQKPRSDQAAITHLLQTPVENVDLPEPEVSAWLRDLNGFFTRETDLRPFDC